MSGLFPDRFLDRLLFRNSHTCKSWKPGFRIESIAKINVLQKSEFHDFGVDVVMFFECLGHDFYLMLSKQVRKSSIFMAILSSSWILSSNLVRGDLHVGWVPNKHLAILTQK